MVVGLCLGCEPPQEGQPQHGKPTSGAPVRDVSSAIPSVQAQMQQKPLEYTRHARCRMQCRKFDEFEVEAMLRDGELKPERTRKGSGERCDTHALEGRTRDGQFARIVYAACDDETRVVTAIDLDTDWPCDCN